MSKISHNREGAQTAIELAVFGAILVFVIGLIVRQGLNVGLQQNQNLRAMRLAMLMSYQYSENRDLQGNQIYTGAGAGYGYNSRNSASVLIVEDRLSADSGKFGSTNRTPIILSGRGTHSNNLFQPLEVGEYNNLPIFDIFINGVHIPLRTGNFKKIQHLNDNTDPAYPATSLWEPQCVQITSFCRGCPAGSLPTCVPDCAPGCSNFSTACATPSTPPTVSWTAGCTKFYKFVANSTNSKVWCDDTTAHPCPAQNIPSSQRFDLDHNGTIDVTNDGIFPDYKDFSWQWFLVKGFDENKDQSSTVLFNTPPLAEGINMANSKNIEFDIDGDLKEERIVKVTSTDRGVVSELDFIDFQEGDIDFTYNSSDTGPLPGLTKDLELYSYTYPGTYLNTEEGQLFGGGGNQFVRSVQKKNQVDVIQRIVQLSHDTDRFCDRTGAITAPGSPDYGNSGWNASAPNPVEACNNCLTTANRSLTCFDESTLRLYVRSRIQDLHGRKWVTDISSDSYVDFQSP